MTRRAVLTGNIRFLRDRRGATAVEFALVAGLFILTIVFVMTVGLIMYWNQALDYATSKAARQIMIGAVQKNSVSQSSFRTNIVCPYLPASMNCNNVIVNVQTVVEAAGPAGYYTLVNSSTTALIIPPLSNGSTQYSVGAQGSYQYLQVIYPVTFLPSAFKVILGGQATYNGAPAFLIVSTAAFKNEQF